LRGLFLDLVDFDDMEIETIVQFRYARFLKNNVDGLRIESEIGKIPTSRG
jgi:hypothetical protein